ncbi:MAG TPA: aminotransferase class IV [Vicinamibacterales bacterium]|nr:aminotransferase class IV [Vicinamibacterales bacterium]
MTDTSTIVWVDGRRLPSDGVHVSARDRGFTLADGVFETMKARNGKVFRLDRHLARLEASLRTLSIPVPSELRDWVHAALNAAHLAETSVRLTVTRGVSAGGVVAAADVVPTVVVTIAPPPVFGTAIYDAGLTACVASGRRNEFSMTAGLKTLAYTDSVAAMIEAMKAGADEVLFLDTAGHCSEASASNLFALINGRLTTPPTSCAALPGITRAAVIELAGDLGVAVDERPFDLRELLTSTEAFLTSSLRGIAPLVSVEGQTLGAGVPGPVTRQVMAAYAALASQECGT